VKTIASAILLLLLAVPARAEPVLAVLQKAGLMGAWAPDCNAPRSAQNPFVIYYVAQGEQVRRRIERGSAGPVLDGTVDRAEALTPTTYRLLLRNQDPNWGSNDGRSFDTVVEVSAGRARALSSVANDGAQLIRDGRYTTGSGAGTPVPGLLRCANRNS